MKEQIHPFFNLNCLHFFLSLFLIISFIFVSSCFLGCEKEPDPDLQLVGPWRHSIRGIHRILTLRANKSWKFEVRIEGRYTKIVKKNEKATGTWSLDEGVLNLFVIKPSAEIGFEQDATVSFELLELTKDKMLLRPESGQEKEWAKVRGQKKETEVDVGEVTVKLGPMVVNLIKEKSLRKDRFLCIDLDFTLKEYESDVFEEHIHPKVRETIIFYLSSLTYKDVDKLQKIDIVKSQLGNMLNPYFHNKISRVLINKFVVTANKDAVENFFAQYNEANEAEQEEK